MPRNWHGEDLHLAAQNVATFRRKARTPVKGRGSHGSRIYPIITHIFTPHTLRKRGLMPTISLLDNPERALAELHSTRASIVNRLLVAQMAAEAT